MRLLGLALIGIVSGYFLGSGLLLVLSQFTVIDTVPPFLYFTPYITSAIVGVCFLLLLIK
ncbi:MAG: hypothetical protein ACFWTY_16590 [Shouchella clausii]|jgi:hypothetical protein